MKETNSQKNIMTSKNALAFWIPSIKEEKAIKRRSHLEKIVPCGLDKVKVGKLSNWIPGIKVCDVKPLLRESVERRFKLNWEKIN